MLNKNHGWRPHYREDESIFLARKEAASLMCALEGVQLASFRAGLWRAEGRLGFGFLVLYCPSLPIKALSACPRSFPLNSSI